MAANVIARGSTAWLGPAVRWATVTVSDSGNLAPGCRGIFVGTTGDIALVGEDNTAVTFKGIPDGTFLPVAAKRVNSTNTTATDIVALY